MEIERGGPGGEHVPLSSGATSSAPVARGAASGGGMVQAAGQRLAKWQKSTVKTLSRMKIPFKVPSLIDRTQPYISGITRFGITGFWNLINDPFHTMLNMPWRQFILMFFTMYFVEYILFAFLFYIQGDHCVQNMDGKFSHALWLSSRTASTLGFDEIRPNPDCGFINFCVMFEVVSASLLNFIMLGVVFARFSAPFKRASTVRFSAHAVCHGHPSGYWAISMRVANLRKHQILQPAIRLVVTAVDSITPSNYIFEHLKIEGATAQETNIELGFPANLVHVISPDSYLYNLSLLEMDTRMMEILVFVDGIDAMTSKHMSAKFSYSTNDILLNQVHVPLNLEMRGKKLGLDFKEFDKTVAASSALEDELNQRKAAGVDGGASASVAAAAAGAEATAQAGWQLRHQTFRRLAERYGVGAGPGTRGNGGSSSGNGNTYATTTGAAGGMNGTGNSTGPGSFEGNYLYYRRASGAGAPGATGHGQQGQQGHVALSVDVGGVGGVGDGGARPRMDGGAVPAKSAGGYAPLAPYSPDAMAPASAAAPHTSVNMGMSMPASSSAGGAAPPASYQPPTSMALVPPLPPPPPAYGQSSSSLSSGGAGFGAGAMGSSVAVVPPELAAATPHLWDPSVSGLAPYATYALPQPLPAGGSAAAGAQAYPAAGAQAYSAGDAQAYPVGGTQAYSAGDAQAYPGGTDAGGRSSVANSTVYTGGSAGSLTPTGSGAVALDTNSVGGVGTAGARGPTALSASAPSSAGGALPVSSAAAEPLPHGEGSSSNPFTLL